MKVYALICAHKENPEDSTLCYLASEELAVSADKDLLEQRRKYLKEGHKNHRYTIVTLPWEVR